MEYYILYVILNYFIIIITYSWYFPTCLLLKFFHVPCCFFWCFVIQQLLIIIIPYILYSAFWVLKVLYIEGRGGGGLLIHQYNNQRNYVDIIQLEH